MTDSIQLDRDLGRRAAEVDDLRAYRMLRAKSEAAEATGTKSAPEPLLGDRGFAAKAPCALDRPFQYRVLSPVHKTLPLPPPYKGGGRALARPSQLRRSLCHALARSHSLTLSLSRASAGTETGRYISAATEGGRYAYPSV